MQPIKSLKTVGLAAAKMRFSGLLRLIELLVILPPAGVGSACADTLYGPGTITILTNQAIVINTFGGDTQFSIDGQSVDVNPNLPLNPRVAIAGPHSVTITNADGWPSLFITFQRLKSSAIKTLITSGTQTNAVSVPPGKTIQFFDSLGQANISIQPTNSANVYNLIGGQYSGESGNPSPYTRPSATGAGIVAVSNFYGSVSVVSYYFVAKPRVSAPVDLMYSSTQKPAAMIQAYMAGVSSTVSSLATHSRKESISFLQRQLIT